MSEPSHADDEPEREVPPSAGGSNKLDGGGGSGGGGSGGGADPSFYDTYDQEPFPEKRVDDDDEDDDDDAGAASSIMASIAGGRGGGGASIAGSVARSLAQTAATLGEGVRHAVAHWRVLLFGQLMSFLLAGTGAASATLHFECRLSAPAFQSLFMYFALGLHTVGLFRRGGGDGGGTNKSRMRREEGRRPLGRWWGRKMDGLDDEAAATPGSHPLHSSRLVRDEVVRELDDEEMEAAADDAARAVAEVGRDRGEDDASSVGSDEAAAGEAALSFGPSGAPPGHSCLCGLLHLHAPPLAYFVLAFLDVEANYLTYLAFRYTTFASISLFDALAIPSAMVFSRALLSREYQWVHLFGAVVCMAGVVVNVFSDYEEEQRMEALQEQERSSYSRDYGQEELGSDPFQNGDDAYPYRVWGDLLAISGGILYGLNDVLVELAVRNWGGREELLSMLGVFGTLVSAVQVLLLERDDVAKFFGGGTTGQHLQEVQFVFDDDTVGDDVERTIANEEATHHHCSTSTGLLLLWGYVVANYLAYVGTARFLSVSEAALLNLSLLTGDLWAVFFSVVAEHIVPRPLFWAALVLIVSGVVIYEIGPSPIVEEDGTGHHGREIRIRHRRRRRFGRGHRGQPDEGLKWGYDNEEEEDDDEELELTEHAAHGGRRTRRGRMQQPTGLGFV